MTGGMIFLGISVGSSSCSATTVYSEILFVVRKFTTMRNMCLIHNVHNRITFRVTILKIEFLIDRDDHM